MISNNTDPNTVSLPKKPTLGEFRLQTLLLEPVSCSWIQESYSLGIKSEYMTEACAAAGLGADALCFAVYALL